MKVTIVSRNSPLALTQAKIVQNKLAKFYPQMTFNINAIVTKGDRILDMSLDKIGGKALFIKELEQALLDKSADIAIHSLKDVPVNLIANFKIAAILKRGDARDCFISNNCNNFKELPNNAIIGTSSKRRSMFIKKYHPNIDVKLLRGNIQTRLAKLDNNEFDAIILAKIALDRLKLSKRIKKSLSLNSFIPAIGQGAIAIEILASNNAMATLLQPINDLDTVITTTAERKVGLLLRASCSSPIAVHARLINNNIKIIAMIIDLDNIDNYCFAKVIMLRNNYLQAAEKCADLLLKQGAQNILFKYN